MAELLDNGVICAAIAIEKSSAALRTDFIILIDYFVWMLKEKGLRLR